MNPNHAYSVDSATDMPVAPTMPLRNSRFLRTTLLAGLALLAPLPHAASAAEPTGQWMVADGNARIKIGPCGDAYWGVIDWAARPGDVDKNNPDTSKRNRSVIGMPILLGMRPSGPNEWSGQVYNAQNGGTYDARIALTGENVLKITGCVLGGLFCGGENWSRATESQAMPGRAPVRPQNSAKPARPQANTPQNRTPPGAQAAPNDQVCPDPS